MCDNRMVRQDLLDQIVWIEVIRLLEDPTLIQRELDRRLTAARSSDPTKKREQNVQRDLICVGKGIERLLTAYQEELLSLEQLRERMPALRQREQTLRAELQAIADQATDRATFLRLAETLTTFLGRLRSAADTLDIIERQRIVRLVVKDISLVTIVSSSGIVSPLGWHLRRTTARQLPLNPKACQAAKVTFCVRGVLTPPCGVPASVG